MVSFHFSVYKFNTSFYSYNSGSSQTNFIYISRQPVHDIFEMINFSIIFAPHQNKPSLIFFSLKVGHDICSMKGSQKNSQIYYTVNFKIKNILSKKFRYSIISIILEKKNS